MINMTGNEFAKLINHVLDFPLFIKDLEVEDKVKIDLPVYCYDPDTKVRDEHLESLNNALKESSLEKRIALFDIASQKLDASNYEFYSIGVISFSTMSTVSNLKINLKHDNKNEQIAFDNLEGFLLFLTELSSKFKSLVLQD